MLECILKNLLLKLDPYRKICKFQFNKETRKVQLKVTKIYTLWVKNRILNVVFSSDNEAKLKKIYPQIKLTETVTHKGSHKKSALLIHSKSVRKHSCRSVTSIEMHVNLIEITFLHGRPPANLLHICRKPFFEEYL